MTQVWVSVLYKPGQSGMLGIERRSKQDGQKAEKW
jgi:hypothetical protein